MYTSLQIKFLIFIVIVIVITIGFGILIMRQMNKMGRKALAAKQHQMEYLNQMDEDSSEESNE